MFQFTSPGGKWTKTIHCDGEQLKVNFKRDDQDTYELIAGYDRPDKEARIEIRNAGMDLSLPHACVARRSVVLISAKEVILHAGARKPSADTFELQLWHSQNRQKIEDISVVTTLKEESRVRSRLFVRPGFKTEYGVC